MHSQIMLEHVDCALCGEDNTDLLFVGRDRLHNKEGEFGVVKCKDCGLIYTNPRPTREQMAYYYPQDYSPYQSFHEGYTEIFNNIKSFSGRIKNEIKKILLKEYYHYPQQWLDCQNIGKNPKLPHWLKNIFLHLAVNYFKTHYYKIPPWKGEGKCLDFGCGKGEYLITLKKMGWNVTGFDISDYVRESDVSVITGKFDKSNFPKDEIFDLITMWHSLEHTRHPLLVLKEAHRLLRKEGWLYIEVPDNQNLINRFFREDWFAWDVPRHLYHFSLATLKKMLRKAGFRITFSKYLPLNYIMGSLVYFLKRHKLFLKCDLNKNSPLKMFLYYLGHFLATIHNSDIIFVCAQKEK